MRLLFVLAIALFTVSGAAFAAPKAYVLDTGSTVVFTYTLLGTRAKGTIPIKKAELSLDFASIERSRARVELNARGVETKVGFVTDALKGEQVLWAGNHPVISFTSTKITGDLNNARIHGDITVRGMTRPIILSARVYRRAGTEPGDLSQLTVLLAGSIDRSAFGASGYSDQVADRVELNITARLRIAN